LEVTQLTSQLSTAQEQVEALTSKLTISTETIETLKKRIEELEIVVEEQPPAKSEVDQDVRRLL
jgi:peptidoglycan hydrolase CwlO-like protein